MTREDLTQGALAGLRFNYLFFWGHKPEPDGSVGAGCLSQWWPAAFEVDGDHYLTSEHYMMASKARLFHDEQALGEILACEHPARAKKIGRRVRGFDQGTWANHRSQIVTLGSVEKFRQNEEELQFLLGTAQRVLVEASPRDRIWGIGMSKNHVNAKQPSKWRGRNLLGFALMDAREQLLARIPT